MLIEEKTFLFSLFSPGKSGRNGALLRNVAKFLRLRFELPTNDHYLSLRCLQFITCVSVLSITLHQTRLIFDMSSIELHFSEEDTSMPLPRVECFSTKKGGGTPSYLENKTHIYVYYPKASLFEVLARP